MATKIRIRLVPFLLVCLWLILPSPTVDASGCETECAAEVGCYGSCRIDLPECGASCAGEGCTLDCNGQNPGGGAGGPCTTVALHVKCYKPGQSPQPIPQPQFQAHGTDWAVIVYTPTKDALPGKDGLVMAASSSSKVAKEARERAAQSFRQTLGRSAEREVGPRPGVPLRYFHVEPTTPCAKVGARLVDRKLPFNATSGTGIFLRGVTNGEGRIATAEVLYSDTEPGLQSAFLEFAKENLRAWRTDELSRPVEIFLFLGAFGKGEAGVAWAGGSGVFGK